MNDAHDTSTQALPEYFDELDIEAEAPINENLPSIELDARRRLEERLAERLLEREMREFDFDC
ncbi:PA3496 family putative envelope integrity protein [Eionea flava]